MVIASFLVNMIADGVTFSFGVLFDKLEGEFGESKAVTAGVISLFHAVPLISGPVASALTDRYVKSSKCQSHQKRPCFSVNGTLKGLLDNYFLVQ